jgi:NAD(P)-dependent dehydrogenase (short-subunit alcohol dehydrogenase family)
MGTSSVDSPVSGRGVVVTGAGNGIGRALATRLAAEGARVVVNDLDAEACTKVAEDIGGVAAPGDAATVEGVSVLIKTARDALGEIDIYFANAGVETGARDRDDDWQRSWDVNVMAHVRAFRELAPTWLARGEGRFVATVSAAGLLTMLGSAPYSVTKHGALAHAEWLSATYGDRGITVQCICPQGVRTNMLPEDTAAGRVLLGDSVIEPEDVASVVMEALRDDRFLILPHPEVQTYYELRARDTNKWLRGMRRLQQRITELS